jgi:hypothetical protein
MVPESGMLSVVIKYLLHVNKYYTLYVEFLVTEVMLVGARHHRTQFSN